MPVALRGLRVNSNQHHTKMTTFSQKSFAGDLPDIAEESEAFEQFSFNPEKGSNIPS